MPSVSFFTGQLKVLTGRLADESLPMTLPAIDDLQEIYELAVLAHTVSEAGVPVIEKTEPLYFMGMMTRLRAFLFRGSRFKKNYPTYLFYWYLKPE